MIVEHGAGRARDLRQGRAERPDPLALAVDVDLEPGAGIGREAADHVVHLRRRPRPVDARLARVDLLGVGDASLGLRPAIEPTALERRQGMHQQRGAACGERVMQFARRHVAADGDAGFQADRAGVEALVEPHDRHAALPVAGHDGAVDGRRAPPARQQRGMQVEGAVARAVENWLRQDDPVGHDHRGIGVERSEPLPAPRRFSAAPACARRGPLARPPAARGMCASAMPRPAWRGGWV